MKKLSIKTKITLWYTLIMLVFSMIALFLMMSVSREILINDSAEKLKRAVEHTIPIINAPKSEPPDDKPGFEPRDDKNIPKDDFRKFPGFMFFNNGVHTAVYDESRNIINGAIPFEFADEIEFADGEIKEKSFDGDRFLTYAKRINQSNNIYWTVGVISIADESVLLKSVSKSNLILILLLISAAAFGGYLILKQAFKPVKKISKTAKLISKSNDLSQRIGLNNGKDEIYKLAEVFDEMLDKIEKTLENEKQFTADASHELRTPVAVISSECEYAIECASSLDEARESVVSIKAQADRMTKLISELLELSRMDKNAISICIEEINVSELLNFICDEQEEINNKNITLLRSIDPDIIHHGDSLLITRLFVNLISNGYRYGKENGNIKISLAEHGEEIIFKAEDDGIGIEEDELSKIWERFYQVNSARTNENGGMGLGLAMVKLIAEKIGGRVYAESQHGKGSVFTLVFPKIVKKS